MLHLHLSQFGKIKWKAEEEGCALPLSTSTRAPVGKKKVNIITSTYDTYWYSSTVMPYVVQEILEGGREGKVSV